MLEPHVEEKELSQTPVCATLPTFPMLSESESFLITQPPQMDTDGHRHIAGENVSQQQEENMEEITARNQARNLAATVPLQCQVLAMLSQHFTLIC